MGGQLCTVNNITCISGFLPTGSRSGPTYGRRETPIAYVWNKPCHACSRFLISERFCKCGRAALVKKSRSQQRPATAEVSNA